LKFAYKCLPFLSFFIYRKKSYRKEKQGADLPFFKRRRPTLVLAIAVIQRVCFPLQISDQRICCKMSTFLLIFVYMCFYCEHEASSGEICCCDALHLTATCTKHGQILTVSVPHMVSNSLTLTTTQACRLRRVGRRSRSHQQSEEKQKAEQSKDLTYPITDTWSLTYLRRRRLLSPPKGMAASESPPKIKCSVLQGRERARAFRVSLRGWLRPARPVC
jgi:hypothetical protein